MQTETELDIRDIQLRTLSANGTNNGVFRFNDLENFITKQKALWLSQLRTEIEEAIGKDEDQPQVSAEVFWKMMNSQDKQTYSTQIIEVKARNKFRAELRTKLANLLQETK